MTSALRPMLIACTLLSVSAIATAGSPAESSRTVGFADLDLTHPAGVAVLHQRIRAAALEVCRPLLERDPTFIAHSRSCVQDAVARALNEVTAAAPAVTVAQRDDAAANTCLAVVPSNLADQVTWVHCAASRSRLPVTRITEVRILDPYFYR
jgi:UrcA family protein